MNTNYLPYLHKIRLQKAEMTATLIQWSNQSSHSDDVKGLMAMLATLDRAFTGLEGVHAHIQLPPRPLADSKGAISTCPQGCALQIVKRPEAPIQLLFAGHMDTVFPPTISFQKAEVKGPRLNGPGVADMKGGLLIMLKSLEALESSPWSAQIGWKVLITPDEETGSCGSAELYQLAARKYHAGLLFEPSFADGCMVSSRKGSTNICVVAKGKAAHAGRDFATGRNALTALARWLLNVEQLSDSAKGITVNVGQIEGGGAFNIVPDLAQAKVNIRIENPADAVLVKECIQMLTEEANGQEGVSIEVHQLVSRGPKIVDAATDQLFALFQACSHDLGSQLRWRPTGGVCDGNILAESGLPTIDTLGGIGGHLHTSDEYVEIDSLPERACLTALFLLKLGSGEIRLPPKKEAPL